MGLNCIIFKTKAFVDKYKTENIKNIILIRACIIIWASLIITANIEVNSVIVIVSNKVQGIKINNCNIYNDKKELEKKQQNE